MDKHDKRRNPKHDEPHPVTPTTADVPANADQRPTAADDFAPAAKPKRAMTGRPFSDN
jgi:hypothetical protein